METSSTELNVAPWVLYAYDRSTRQTSLLGRSPAGPGPDPAPPPGRTGPVVSGHTAFWAQVSGRPGAERVDVYGCDVTHCRPNRYAAGAAFPAVSGSELYVLRTPRFTGRAPEPRLSVDRVDTGTRRISTVRNVALRKGQTPGGLAASGSTLAWVVAGDAKDTISMLDQASRSTRIVASEPGGAFGAPVATPAYVAWPESSGVSPADVGGYLYDLSNNTLSSIGNTAGLYNVVGREDLISWQDSTTPQVRPQDIVSVIARLR